MLAFAPLDGAASAASVLVTHLATLLGPIGGTAAAIVAFTLLVRLLLHPLTRAAVRGERARQRLIPHLAEVRRKHAKDPTRMAQELSDLYRREGISPLAGMLPMLAQAPFFLVTYQIFASGSVGHHANALMAQTLFGVPFGARFATGAAALGPHVWVFLALFAAILALAWVTSRRSAMLMAANGTPTGGLLGRLPRILPYLTVLTAVFVPLAAGLYVLTSTAWTVVENMVLRRGLPDPHPAVGGASASNATHS